MADWRRRAARAGGSESGVWRRVAAAAACALALLLTAGAAQARSAIDGEYVGVDEATGWKLRFTEKTVAGAAAGYEGAFVDRTGAETTFDGLLRDGGREAEARVELANGPVYLRFSPRPIGLLVTWIPINAENKLDLARTRTYPFVRAGVTLPEPPKSLAPPPKSARDRTDPLVFLNSYEFWTPLQVGFGYVGVDDRWRTLMRLYATVHTDVLWKLCQAARTPPGLTEALEGQAVTCRQVLSKISAMQRSGAFTKYKADVAAEKKRLIDAVKCARGMLLQRQCVKANEWTGRAAISLDTAATILARY